MIMISKKTESKPDLLCTPHATVQKKHNTDEKSQAILPESLLSQFEQKVLIHELEVHQTELEMQKEELLRSRDESEALKEKYFELYDFAPVGYCTIDATGTIQEINLTGSTLLGKNREELILSHFQTFLKPDSRLSFNSFCIAALKTSEKQICDVIIRTKQSGNTYVRLEGRAITSDQGSSTQIRVAIIDISSLKNAESELRETKEYLDNLINYANAPIIVWDPQFRITVFNRASEHLTDRTTEETLGQSIEIIFPQNSLHETMDLLMKTAVGERWESVEIPIITKNGEIRTVLWNSTSLTGNDGVTVISTIAQGQDITERKRIEAEYRVRAEEYAKLNTILENEIAQRKKTDTTLKNTVSLLNASFEATADGILVVDLKGNIREYNQNFLTMWNISRKSVENGEKMTDMKNVLNQLTFPENYLASIRELRENPCRESFDMIEFIDGKVFERYSKPQKIGDHIIGRVWSFRDITARKRAEEKLLASVQEKEVLIREIHHRVKNNLQLMTGLLDMTRMRTQDDATTNILTDMMLKIQTMAQIHTRLYESSEIGKIDLIDQFRDHIASLSSIYSYNGHEITCEIHSPEIFLPVDQALPCALVMNEILSNSYKHAFKGKNLGMIEISACLKDGNIRIIVHDNGTGIPENVDVTQTNSLGLKLIRTLVEHQLRGTITMSNKQGTETVVEFPVMITET